MRSPLTLNDPEPVTETRIRTCPLPLEPLT